MKTLKLLFSAPVLAALLALVVGSLTGKWTVKWVDPVGGKPNPLQLTDFEGVLTGEMTSDDGEKCPANGTHIGLQTKFTIRCQRFEIVMDGVADTDEVRGTYLAYNTARGKFRMERSTCWLSEGCRQ